MKKIAAYVGLATSTDRVYSKDTLQTLSDRYDFIADGKTLTKEELLAHPEAGSVQYLFSTWGMPHFTNEEIRTVLPAAEAVFYGAGRSDDIAYQTADAPFAGNIGFIVAVLDIGALACRSDQTGNTLVAEDHTAVDTNIADLCVLGQTEEAYPLIWRVYIQIGDAMSLTVKDALEGSAATFGRVVPTNGDPFLPCKIDVCV